MFTNELDLKLLLQSGESIYINSLVKDVKPLTLRQIIKYGYSNYLTKLQLMTLEANDLLGEKLEGFDVNVFDIYVELSGDEIRQEVESALELFFQDKVIIDKEEKIIIIGDDVETARVIDRDNFDLVREVIKFQNCIKVVGKDAIVVQEESEAVRRIREKLQKGKETVAKIKREEDDSEVDIDISDIISAVSSKSNSLNKITVYDLTLYQLYEEIKRLEMIDQYYLGIKSLMAGAKEVNLKHWSNKLDW